MLVYIRGTPIWQPEYSVNIWNLLWLSRRLIISTKQASIHITTFPNALTSKKAQNHEISIYFFNKLDRSLVSRNLHNPEIKNAFAVQFGDHLRSGIICGPVLF